MRRTEPVLSSEFEKLFDEQFAYVCRALRRLGVRASDVPDVAQELFVTVHRRLDDYRRERPIRPWLFVFAVKFAANYRRLARNQAVELEAEHPVARSPNTDARDLVLRALATLDFERRTVLVMHDLEGFAAPEIAEATETPLNTVYSRLRLARADFRAAVTRLSCLDGGSS